MVLGMESAQLVPFTAIPIHGFLMCHDIQQCSGEPSRGVAGGGSVRLDQSTRPRSQGECFARVEAVAAPKKVSGVSPCLPLSRGVPTRFLDK